MPSPSPIVAPAHFCDEPDPAPTLLQQALDRYDDADAAERGNVATVGLVLDEHSREALRRHARSIRREARRLERRALGAPIPPPRRGCPAFMRTRRGSADARTIARSLWAMGGEDFVCVERAARIVQDGWSPARWARALTSAVRAGLVVLIVGPDVAVRVVEHD